MKVTKLLLAMTLALACGLLLCMGCGDDDDDDDNNDDEGGDDDAAAGTCEGEQTCYEEFEQCALASTTPAEYWGCGLTWSECVTVLDGCSADFLACQEECNDEETCIEDNCVSPYESCLDECCDGACVEACSRAYETCMEEAPIDIDEFHACSQTFADCMDPCY